MNMRWNLDKLYTSFDAPEFLNDLKKCDGMIKDIQVWSEKNFTNNEQAAQKIATTLKMTADFQNLANGLYNYASLIQSVDSRNQLSIKYSEILEKKFTELTAPTVQFQTWLAKLENLDALISSSPELQEFAFYLKETAEHAKHNLSEKEEIVIAKMKQTGGSAWVQLQGSLTSSLLVDIEINGEKKQLPLPAVRNMAYESDAATRKTAYEAELAAYKKVDEAVAACINAVKGESITISELRGYNSVLDKVLNNSRLDKESLDAMLLAMEESLPDFEKYFLKKAEKLGYTSGLPFYEMFAPMGDLNRSFTYEESHEFIVANFGSFSSKLANLADRAYKENWIDAEQREGKRGGAFCAGIHHLGESRIMTNYSNSYSSVTTMAHELGHAYHGECLKHANVLNSDYPMPVAETASIFCETIVNNAFVKTLKPEEQFTILESSISDAAQVIVDIYSRYLFESELVNRRKESSLSVDELKEIMLDAQKKAYRNGLDHNLLHPYMWLCKPHYYGSDFYNFPYAFGLLFAKGLYAEYLKRGEKFVQEYDDLLAATGKNSIADVAKTMGIDIKKPDFWRASLDLIRADIKKFCEL